MIIRINKKDLKDLIVEITLKEIICLLIELKKWNNFQ